MAKRFTDTNKYKKPFIRGLQGAYKLLWDYLYHDCDHAGIWIVDFEIAQIMIGKDMPVNKSDAIKFFNEGEIRIIEIAEGSKWFILPFIEFQYGELNPGNRAHNSVISILKKYNLYDDNKGLISPLEGCKDKDKDKDKDNDPKKTEKTTFDESRKIYPGIKRGLQTEFADFCKKHKDWREVLPLLKPAIEKQIKMRSMLARNEKFVPEWKHFKTWINQRCWEDEIESKRTEHRRCTCGRIALSSGLCPTCEKQKIEESLK